MLLSLIYLWIIWYNNSIKKKYKFIRYNTNFEMENMEISNDIEDNFNYNETKSIKVSLIIGFMIIILCDYLIIQIIKNIITIL